MSLPVVSVQELHVRSDQPVRVRRAAETELQQLRDEADLVA